MRFNIPHGWARVLLMMGLALMIPIVILVPIIGLDDPNLTPAVGGLQFFSMLVIMVLIIKRKI